MRHPVFIPFNPGNRDGFWRPPGQPIEAGDLRVVVHQRDLFPLHGEIAGEVGCYSAFAAATLGIQEHYMTHFFIPNCAAVA
jgi:hypothetical protein